MPKKRRPAKIPTPTWERPRGALGRRIMGRSPQLYATVGIIVLVFAAVGIVGFAYWSDYRAKQQRPGSTAVQIDDTKYTLRYFTDRLRMFVQQSGGPAANAAQPQLAIPAVTSQLVQEALVLRFADEKGVSASDDDIKSEIVTRLGLKAGDTSFDARYREELSRSGLAEQEYRQMIQAAVLTNKIGTVLEGEAPASAESVHLRQIVVSDQTAADDIVRQLQAGADFAQLAAQLSLDTSAQSTGGDIGWIARGVFDKNREDTVFNLELGKLTSFASQSYVYVYQVLEKAPDRPIDPAQKPQLATRAFQDWLTEKQGQVNVQEFVSQDADNARWAIDRAYKLT